MMLFYEGVQSWNIELIHTVLDRYLILAIKTTALSHTSPFWSNHIPIPLPHETVLVLVPLQLLRFSPPAQWARAAAPRLQASYSDSLALVNGET